MIARCGMTLFGMILLAPAYAQQGLLAVPTPAPAQDTSNTGCIEKLQIPAYPLLARQARLTGTLSVTVDLGTNGNIEKVSARSQLNNDRAQSVLLMPIESVLRKSRFRRECAGKQITLVFEFGLYGDPYDDQQQEVAFGSPNRFFITARPPIPANSH
jgi:hypothetical protein